MAKFAKDTNVSVEKSRGEIETNLQRYGATAFSYMVRNSPTDAKAMVQFESDEKVVQFVLPLPDFNDFSETETGRERSPEVQLKHWEQACRQRWRALNLCIKAKLEAVECGITTFEQEFLAHIIVPGTNKTIGSEIIPKIEKAYDENTVPLLTFDG